MQKLSTSTGFRAHRAGYRSTEDERGMLAQFLDADSTSLASSVSGLSAVRQPQGRMATSSEHNVKSAPIHSNGRRGASSKRPGGATRSTSRADKNPLDKRRTPTGKENHSGEKNLMPDAFVLTGTTVGIKDRSSHPRHLTSRTVRAPVTTGHSSARFVARERAIHSLMEHPHKTRVENASSESAGDGVMDLLDAFGEDLAQERRQRYASTLSVEQKTVPALVYEENTALPPTAKESAESAAGDDSLQRRTELFQPGEAKLVHNEDEAQSNTTNFALGAGAPAQRQVSTKTEKPSIAAMIHRFRTQPARPRSARDAQDTAQILQTVGNEQLTSNVLPSEASLGDITGTADSSDKVTAAIARADAIENDILELYRQERRQAAAAIAAARAEQRNTLPPEVEQQMTEKVDINSQQIMQRLQISEDSSCADAEVNALQSTDLLEHWRRQRDEVDMLRSEVLGPSAVERWLSPKTSDPDNAFISTERLDSVKDLDEDRDTQMSTRHSVHPEPRHSGFCQKQLLDEPTDSIKDEDDLDCLNEGERVSPAPALVQSTDVRRHPMQPGSGWCRPNSYGSSAEESTNLAVLDHNKSPLGITAPSLEEPAPRNPEKSPAPLWDSAESYQSSPQPASPRAPTSVVTGRPSFAATSEAAVDSDIADSALRTPTKRSRLSSCVRQGGSFSAVSRSMRRAHSIVGEAMSAAVDQLVAASVLDGLRQPLPPLPLSPEASKSSECVAGEDCESTRTVASIHCSRACSSLLETQALADQTKEVADDHIFGKRNQDFGFLPDADFNTADYLRSEVVDEQHQNDLNDGTTLDAHTAFVKNEAPQFLQVHEQLECDGDLQATGVHNGHSSDEKFHQESCRTQPEREAPSTISPNRLPQAQELEQILRPQSDDEAKKKAQRAEIAELADRQFSVLEAPCEQESPSRTRDQKQVPLEQGSHTYKELPSQQAQLGLQSEEGDHPCPNAEPEQQDQSKEQQKIQERQKSQLEESHLGWPNVKAEQEGKLRDHCKLAEVDRLGRDEPAHLDLQPSVREDHPELHTVAVTCDSTNSSMTASSPPPSTSSLLRTEHFSYDQNMHRSDGCNRFSVGPQQKSMDQMKLSTEERAVVDEDLGTLKVASVEGSRDTNIIGDRRCPALKMVIPAQQPLAATSVEVEGEVEAKAEKVPAMNMATYCPPRAAQIDSPPASRTTEQQHRLGVAEAACAAAVAEAAERDELMQLLRRRMAVCRAELAAISSFGTS
eukprot:SAG31_NODE_619_length_13509_cov_3.297539_2_plen_1239_part_00